MEPSQPPSAAQYPTEERGSATRAPRSLFIFSAPFFQAIFLCLLAAASALAQISGGVQLDAVLATGIGLLLGFLLYRSRLFILTALVLPLGIVNQLFDQGIISGHYLEPAHLLALALGLLTITWATYRRPAWVRPGARSPGIIVAALGLLLLLALASGHAATIIFSFWLPAIVLGGLGVGYLAMPAFGRAKP
jgi:hypothetical protein